MTSQHSDPPRDPTDTRSEVLSDATDLDVLLEALLGDQVAPIKTEARRDNAVTAPVAVPVRLRDEVTPAVSAGARPEPTVVAPPLTRVDPGSAVARGATADDNDAWGFVSEDPQQVDEIADDFGAVRQTAPAVLEPPLSQRTWRDTFRVSLSKQSLLVAALLAAALITASAISLRDQPTETQNLPTSEAPALAQSSSPTQNTSPLANTSAVAATDSPEIEVWAAAREPEAQPRAISRTPSRRPNEVTNARTRPPTAPASADAPRSAPAPSPVVAAPAPAEPITEPADRAPAPSRTATTEAEPRRLVESAPPVAASGASAVNGAEPAPTVAAPVPAVVPRQSAARLLTGGAPEYPAALRTARIGGSVEVRFTIDSSGRVINVQSVSGPLQLRSAAEAAVRRWRYEAARVDNVAVETQTSVRFNFEPLPDRRPQE